MKKILMGLLAVSAISFSAIDMTSPANETNVWNTGEVGTISIKGNITSNVPQVQYVVYSSMDGTYDKTTGEFWQLTDWVISRKEADNHFIGVNPKIYVKRVNGAKDNVDDLLVSEVVSFKIELDPAITTPTYKLDQWIKTGSTPAMSPFALLPVSTAQALLSRINVGGVTGILFNSNGYAEYTDSSRQATYRPPKWIKFNVVEKGVLEIAETPNPYIRNYIISDEASSNIEAAYSNAQAINGAKVLVKIN